MFIVSRDYHELAFFQILTPGKKRVFIDKAQPVSKRIERVKASLAPRSDDDLARGRAVNFYIRETFERRGSLVNSFEIGNCKINILGVCGLFIVEQRQDHPAAIKIAAPAADVTALDAEQSRIKLQPLRRI